MKAKISTAALALAALLGVAAGRAAAQSCTLPPPPGAGATDANFDNLMMQNGPGWTGADSSYTLGLPSGDTLFLWSDSYIGTVDPATRLRSSDLFQAHNSLTVWNPATGSYTTVGYPKTTSYFVPTNKTHWFWVGAPLLVQPSPGVYQIKVMLTEWTPSLTFVGNSLATLAYPSLSILSIQPVKLANTIIVWGSWLLAGGAQRPRRHARRRD